MLRNYLTIALRSIIRNKGYSFINIIGLSLGMTVSLLILLYVSHEVSYDRFHNKADRLYRMTGKVNYGGQDIFMTALSAQFGPMVLQNDAGVENYVRVNEARRVLIKTEGTEAIFENRFIFSDTSFFSVFSFPLLKGTRSRLAEPNKVIITERMAKKYFGSDDAIGKLLTYDKETLLEIAGIAKNPPSNSSIQFDFVGSFSTLANIPSEKGQYEHNLASLGAYTTYLLLKKNVKPDQVERTMAKLVSHSIEEKYSLELFMLHHLDDQRSGNSTTAYLYVFSVIAIIILLLALINYMSLTTARATIRAKEVGIRKVIGAGRSNLSAQFFLESTLMTVIAFVLAIVWLELLLPAFLSTLQLTIDHRFIQSATFITISITLFVICVFLAGSYPALVLSRFVPMQVIKGRLSGIGKGAWVRKGFTVFQFAASIGLILCAMVIQRQLEFMKNQKIGMNKEQVMVVNLDPGLSRDYQALKNEIKDQAGILKVASASFPLFTSGTSGLFTQTPTTKEDVFMNYITVDGEFFSALGIEWKEKPLVGISDGKYVLNEAGLNKFKITLEDIGKGLDLGLDKSGSEIIGVVKDFNFESLRSKVSGLIISVEADTANVIARNSGALYIRLDPNAQLAEKIQSIQGIFNKYQGQRPFEYYFLDDAFDTLYKTEDRLARMFNAFTAVAIFIACLGLLGLITFTSEVRTKEIGIRKVLGAGVQSIMLLLTKDYFLLIGASMLLATPVAWWYLHHWLNGFSYKIEIPWWYVLLAAGFALVIAFATTVYQVLKSATVNPVESLRSE